jgi:AhpD family alkylhydroperoxidase
MTLDNRITELIAVGTSVTANCLSCLEYHVSNALESGADSQEIKEAVEVGKVVRRGAASNLDKLALSLIQGAPSTVSAADGACGCSS